jgi:GNAT superfamily N-acetyltransferase
MVESTSNSKTKLTQVQLDKSVHDRNGFDCGSEELNKFLQQQAAAMDKRGLAKTQVLVDEQNPSEILAYMTLKNSEVVFAPGTKVPGRSNPPNNTAPALLLARMGVAQQHQGKTLGKHLITSVILQVAECYRHPAIPPFIGIVVDPKDGADGFYRKFGFVEFEAPDGKTRLFLPLETCLQFAQASGY